MDYIYNLSSQPDYHDIMVCRIQAGQNTSRELLISYNEYKKLLKIADRYAYFYSKKRYGGFILGIVGYVRHKILNYIYLNAYNGRQIIRCKAPEFIRVLEADGQVRICELGEEAWNIRDYNYNLNEMDKTLRLSSKEVHCACTHPCFVVPSLNYPSNIIRYCKSIFIDNITFPKSK